VDKEKQNGPLQHHPQQGIPLIEHRAKKQLESIMIRDVTKDRNCTKGKLPRSQLPAIVIIRAAQVSSRSVIHAIIRTTVALPIPNRDPQTPPNRPIGIAHTVV
jgi:hypothetical protein